MAEIGRLLTAMVTPFDDRGEVDYQQAQRLAVALLESGSDGVVVAGTTGEAPTLSTKEKWRLFVEVRKAVAGRGAVVAGTGNYNTHESIELSREAEQIGVDALLLTVPYYNRPTQEGLYRHFEAIARSTRLPCILYNIPSRTGVNMTAETTVRLAQIPNVVGIKEDSGDFRQIATIVEHARGDFRVWSGSDEKTLPVLAVGGYGVVSVAAHLVGTQIKEMMESFLAGRVEEAAAIHRRLLPLVDALFVQTNPIPVKYILNELGFRVGKPRLPLVEPEQAVGEAIMAEVRRHRIDLPVAV
ncbi:MAG TPA: 4-hydroxy-tetrahydrodipicolinate synthase [Dehalococcoidia bacterium]